MSDAGNAMSWPVARPGGLAWFLRHDLRLAVRDWIRPGREGRALLAAMLLMAMLHLGAWWIVRRLPDADAADPATRHFAEILITFFLIPVFGMLVAQAMEAVTRAIYMRGDLDLILSSPASGRRLFAVRMLATAFTTLWLAGFLILPIVDMLIVLHGPQWVGAYGVLLSLALAATALAIALTSGLFRLFGARRTRALAQVVGAVIGAGTVIGAQVPFILHFGGLSVASHFGDPWVVEMLPAAGSPAFALASAVHGDLMALAALLAGSGLAFAAAVVLVSRDFSAMAVATSALAPTRTATGRGRPLRVAASARRALCAKELRLIVRDPWLISQSLTQILYLVPPALLLWRNFGDRAGTGAMLVPVLVMVAAQVAGGLAWLTLSAEDARDLIGTAPVSAATVLGAKIEAVLLAVGMVMAPFLVALGLQSWGLAAVALVFGAAGVASNCLIQTPFRIEASRGQFRRRQRASRLATFCETMVSIAWAGAGGLTAAGSPVAILPAGIALALSGGLALISRWRAAPP